MEMSNIKLKKMKKIIICSGIILCSVFSVYSAETVSFSFSNPKIVYNTGVNYLVFDILMKASANGTYLYSSQIICNVNVANFNTTTNPSFIKGFVAGQYSAFPDPPADKYVTTVNWNSNNLNIAVYGNMSFNGNAPSSGAYAEVTTSWQVLGTVYLKINSLTGAAGVNFQISAINGYQKYATGVVPYYASYYEDPSLFEGKDLTDLALGRIYTGSQGWMQAGGVVDWAQAVSTSVFDTVGASAQISGTTAGSECKAYNLCIHPGARLLIDKDHPLTVNGNTLICNPLGLWITSRSSGTGSFRNTGTITYKNGGSVRVERYITQDSYHYITSPISNALSSVFTGDYLRNWNEPGNVWGPWISTTTEPLEVFRGYEVWLGSSSGSRSFTGSLNSGAQSISFPYTPSGGGGWNLAGNPYPSAQDFGSFSSPAGGWSTWGSNVDRVLYYLTSANGITYQYDTYSWGTGLSTGTATRYIPAMQGYFIKVNTSSGTIGCDNPTRVHNNAVFYKDAEWSNYLRLRTSGGPFTDDIAISLMDGFSNGIDQHYDAYKLTNSDSIPSIFSTTPEMERLAIDIRPFAGETTLVPVGFTVGFAGNFNITAENLDTFKPGMGIFLEDLKMNTFQDLLLNPVYRFAYQKEENPNRFVLHFSNPSFGVDDQKTVKGISIYSFNGDVYVRATPEYEQTGTIMIFDMTGRKIYENRIEKTPLNKFYPGAGEGIYVAKVYTEKGTVSAKIYIKH